MSYGNFRGYEPMMGRTLCLFFLLSCKSTIATVVLTPCCTNPLYSLRCPMTCFSADQRCTRHHFWDDWAAMVIVDKLVIYTAVDGYRTVVRKCLRHPGVAAISSLLFPFRLIQSIPCASSSTSSLAMALHTVHRILLPISSFSFNMCCNS